MCVPVCEYVHVSSSAQRGQVSDLLELQMVMNHPAWVLRVELQHSGGVECALKV